MQPPTSTAARGESDSPLKVCSPLLRAECAASTAATRRSKAMCTRASRRRTALQCCTVRCRRAAHNTCKVVKLRPGGACVRVRTRASLASLHHCILVCGHMAARADAGEKQRAAGCRRRGAARDGKTVVFTAMWPARRGGSGGSCRARGAIFWSRAMSTHHAACAGTDYECREAMTLPDEARSRAKSADRDDYCSDDAS